MKKILLIISIVALGLGMHAQNNSKVSFNGNAYGDLEYNYLPESDTTNIDENSSGVARIDLQINIQPTENIKVHSVLRFQNAVGGFWGEGSFIDLREIALKGVAGNYLKYRFGDIDYKLTPYTLYNYDEELSANEAEIFKYVREIMYQENFNNENYWRQQGVHLQSMLGFDNIIKTADLNGFLFRNSVEDDGVTPDRLQGGGNAVFNFTDSSYLGITYINLFDLPKTVSNSSTEKLSNSVSTANCNIDLDIVSLWGEGGISNLTYIDTNNIDSVDVNGYFYEAGLTKRLKNNQLVLKASFRRVTDDFYSAGAQTKRVNYSTTPDLLATVSENQITRSVGLIDLIKDESIYNTSITSTLMSYEPLFNHVTPYGKATPNRTGFNFDIAYKDSTGKYSTGITADLLQETRGEGTDVLRKFALAQWYGKINFNKIYGFKKTLALTSAYQFAASRRDHEGAAKDVDLNTHCIDLGAEIELVNRVDLLLGTKHLIYAGTEYVSERDDYNEITGYTQMIYDGTQNLTSVALRYRFNDNINLSIMGTSFNVNDNLDSKNDYRITQAFLMFTMLF